MLRDDYRWSTQQISVVSSRHGRIEQRTIQVSEETSDCPESIEFPGVRRMFRILRETKYKNVGRQRRPKTTYFVPVLPDLVRGSWGAAENGIHYIPDIALRENACGVRKDSRPSVLAAFIGTFRYLPKETHALRRSMVCRCAARAAGQHGLDRGLSGLQHELLELQAGHKQPRTSSDSSCKSSEAAAPPDWRDGVRARGKRQLQRSRDPA